MRQAPPWQGRSSQGPARDSPCGDYATRPGANGDYLLRPGADDPDRDGNRVDGRRGVEVGHADRREPAARRPGGRGRTAIRGADVGRHVATPRRPLPRLTGSDDRSASVAAVVGRGRSTLWRAGHGDVLRLLARRDVRRAVLSLEEVD